MTPAKLCAVHRETEAIGACPRCGNFVCGACVEGRANLMCASCVAKTGELERQPTAWERRDELGAPTALWLTWKESMFAPDPFFKKLKPDGSMGDAVLYAFMMMVLAFVPNFMQQALSAEQTLKSFRMLFRGAEWLEGVTWWQYSLGVTVVGIVLFPVFFALGSAAWHVFGLMWGASAGGWSGTVRVMGYSYGVMAAMIVPYVGPLLTLYWFALLVIGVARVHRVSVLRALGAALVTPLAASMCFACALSFAIISALRPSG